MTLKQKGQAAGLFGAVAVSSAVFTWLFIAGRFTDPYVWVQLALGVAGLAFYVATNLDTLGRSVAGRGTFYGIVSGVSAVVLIAALAGLNYIAVKKSKTWDLTKDKIYTLSDQTTSMLKGLKSDVQILAFFGSADQEFSELDQRLKQYKAVTDKLKVEFLDPQRHVKEVKDYNISQSGPRLIVKAGSKETRAKDVTEESLTNAIAEVTRGSAKKIYFSKGHGEHAVSDASERGMKLWVESLRSEGFQVDEIELAANKEMPADAQALVIAGPVASFTDGEIKLVQGWVDKGGKLVAMLDPGISTGLEKMVALFGAKVGNDEVIDTESQQAQVAIAQDYADHPITAPRNSPFALAGIFPFARSVSKTEPPPAGWTVVELARTGSRAWGETDEVKEGAKVAYTPGKDLKGPVSLAVAATHGTGENESRVVIFGNSTFAANGFYRLSGNRDLAMNSVSWVAHEEAKISIRPRSRQANHLFLTADQKHTMTLMAFDVLPFSLLFAGLLVWQTRKSR
ncbi:MAG: GldG family protein [Myxococcales bacterium]